MHLVVAGGGELLDEFRDQARAAGIGERVHFLGPVPHAELPGVLRSADLLLLTTEPPESFGIVLIEAMACGLPTVATEYPGVRAVVDDGETGLVVEPGDAEPVAAAIRRLIEAGPAGRARMGAAGRRQGRAAVGLAAPVGPNGRGLRGGDRGAPAEARMNLLLVAYFYPPCRDTGAHRPAAMAKWLRRLGHRVTVLTTSAYGTGDGAAEEDVVRTPDLQRLRARLHGHDRVDALFDSDTYSGKAAPAQPRCSFPSRWSPPGRRSRARARCGSTVASGSTA